MISSSRSMPRTGGGTRARALRVGRFGNDEGRRHTRHRSRPGGRAFASARRCRKHGPTMRSSARSSVGSASPIGSGSSIRSMAPRSSVGVIRTGEFRSPWRFTGSRRSRSSSKPARRRCFWATRGGGSFESSWPRAKPRRGASRSATTSTLADAVLGAVDDASRARLPPNATRPPATPAPPMSPRSWRGRCVPGRVLPCLGSRAVGAPGRGSRRPIHRSHRWAFGRRRRRPVLERRVARSAPRRASVPAPLTRSGASLRMDRLAPSQHLYELLDPTRAVSARFAVSMR